MRGAGRGACTAHSEQFLTFMRVTVEWRWFLKGGLGDIFFLFQLGLCVQYIVQWIDYFYLLLLFIFIFIVFAA
jgi:hypothetical protein